MKKYLAEMVGTMVLVLMGCGSAVFAGNIAAACGAGVGTGGSCKTWPSSGLSRIYYCTIQAPLHIEFPRIFCTAADSGECRPLCQ